MPVSTIHPAPKPLSDVAGPSRSRPSHMSIVRPFVGKNTRPKLGRLSTGPVPLNDDSIEYVAFIPPHPPTARASNREEMVELLK